MSEGDVESVVATTGASRYRINLVLFIVTVVLLAMWFYRHLYPLATSAIVAGTPLTVAAAVKFVRSFLPKRASADLSGLSDRLLARSGATQFLLFLIGSAMFLLAVTSSVYVEYTGKNEVFDVSVYVDYTANDGVLEQSPKSEAALLLKPIRLTSYDRTAGRPFFLSLRRFFSPDVLEFKITKPFDYEVCTRKLGTWSAVRLRVPDDFTSKKHRVGRIAPVGLELQSMYPRVSADDHSSYTMRLTLGTNQYEIKHYMLETVYFGPHADIIDALIEEEDLEDYVLPLLNALYRVYSTTPLIELRERANMRSRARRPYTIVDELTPDMDILIEVFTGDELTLQMSSRVSAQAGIQTVFLR